MTTEFDKMVIWIQSAAEKFGKGFTAPDDDWIPALFLSGLGHYSIFGVISETPEERNLLIYNAIRQSNAGIAAFLASSWIRTFEASDKEEAEKTFADYKQGDVAKDPKREEFVTVVIVSPSRTALTLAKINRTADAPPTLGAWSVHEGDDNAAGAIPQIMRKALRGAT